jgi:hypothetical protein
LLIFDLVAEDGDGNAMIGGDAGCRLSASGAASSTQLSQPLLRSEA